MTMGAGLLEKTAVAPGQAVCKCCGGASRPCGVVDFSRSCEDRTTGASVEPHAGVPIAYFRCDDCGFVFTPAMDGWTRQDFSAYIYNDDYVRHDPDYLGKRPAMNAALISGSFPEMAWGNVLDFGSGLGLLEKALKSRGFAQVDSYDPYASDAGTRGALAEKYQTVVCFEVFEHHPQPHELMAELKRFLADDGAILFSTLQVTDKVMAEGIENWWYCAPRNGHISLFAPRSLAVLAAQNGLKVGTFSDDLHVFYKDSVPAWAVKFLEGNPAQGASSSSGAAASLIVQGRKLLEAGQLDQAMDALEQASTVDPLEPEAYRLYAQALGAAGMPMNAEVARLGYEALLRNSATDLCGLGQALLQRSEWGMAGYWYKRALLLDPDLVQAHLGMGKVMLEQDRGEEAERHAHQAHQLQSLYVDAAQPTQRRSVLVLCSSGLNDVPVKFLMPGEHSRQIRWAVEYGITGPIRELPPYDLIFNAIGDADKAQWGLKVAQALLATADKPVLNPPDRVMRTSRDQIVNLLSGIEGVYMPPTVRWDSRSGASLAAAIETAGLTYPATLRPAGGHGGKGLARLETSQDAQAAGGQAEPGEHYLSRYCEFRSPDGYYRKYRVVFIDREPMPYHLAIGSQWMLHYVTADMRSHAWKTEQERRFLDDPQSTLGPTAWAALREIGRHLDLDYCGVDFSLLPDGRVLVFEANATMLVHLEKPDDPVLGFKNPYVQRIFDAFEAMLARRMP
jgi:tetratricopeptide (TPR) repeat protein